MQRSQEFQIVVVGAGIAGSSLALALTKAGIKTALIERGPLANYCPGQDYDLRVSAISLASEYLFRNLEVWQQIESARCSPYREMQVWNATGDSTLHFNAAELQQTHLGCIVENNLLQSVLLSHLQQQTEFELINPAEIETISTGLKNVAIKLKNKLTLKAQLIIGADGANSSIREMAAIDIEQWPYRQSGVVTTIETAQHHGYTARQWFLPDGPIALLPLADGRCSIVWTVPKEKAEQLLKIDEQSFCKEVTQASANCLGEVIACEKRAAFPLQYQHAKSYIAPRLALVADAAHVVHPLAGQGINLGLLDVAELAQEIIVAVTDNRDPGSNKLLNRYARARRGENVVMGLAFDMLNRLFATQYQPIEFVRDLGLNIVDHFAWMKRFFMQKATGLEQALKTHQRSRSRQSALSLLSPPEFK